MKNIMPITLDYTAIIIAGFSVVTSLVLGVFQFLKWRADAKKAKKDSENDLVKIALEINKQEIETLRDVISVQKETIKDRDAIIAQTYTSPLKYKETLEENERLRRENEQLKNQQGGI